MTPKTLQATAYIAASRTRIAEVHRLRDELADKGIGLTCDWTDARNLPAPPDGSSGKFRNLRAVRAEAQIKGAAAADIVIVLGPHGLGTAGDLGAALAGGARVLLVGPRDPDQLYHDHPAIEGVETIEQVVPRVLQILTSEDESTDAMVKRATRGHA